MNTPTIKKNIHGILLLDKPKGISSNSALQRVKRLFSAKKAGHTGSLDPLATGMLPICFGEATKVSGYLLESAKQYEVKAQLGATTNTGDAEGDIISRAEIKPLDEKMILSLEEKFSGEQWQIPPMFSAIKVQGQPLYALARQGVEIERAPRKIQIYSLCIQQTAPDELSIRVHCSKGTYVRSLVQDIGETLACGAYVSELRRTWVEPFQKQAMVSLSELENAKSTGQDIEPWVKPISDALCEFPLIQLNAASTFYLKQGQAVQTAEMGKVGMVQLVSEQGISLGMGWIEPDGRVQPKRLFVLE